MTSELKAVGVFIELEERKERMVVVAAGVLNREEVAWLRDRLNRWLMTMPERDLIQCARCLAEIEPSRTTCRWCGSREFVVR